MRIELGMNSGTAKLFLIFCLLVCISCIICKQHFQMSQSEIYMLELERVINEIEFHQARATIEENK